MDNSLEVLSFEDTDIRVTPDKRVSVLDVLKAMGLKDPRSAWKNIKQTYPEYVAAVASYSFGGRGKPTPVIGRDGLLRLLMVLKGPKASEFREWAAAVLVRYLESDVTLAAEIADRASEQEQRWLEHRLRAKRTNKVLNGTIYQHGGVEDIYSQVADTNNVTVTGMRAKQIQRVRGVRQTRDGMDDQELVRIAYLETLESASIEARRAFGNQRIMATVNSVTHYERDLWNAATNPALPTR